MADDRHKKRRVQPQRVELPKGVYFAGLVELRNGGIIEPGIVQLTFASLIMPAFIPESLCENNDKFERSGDENAPLRLYVFSPLNPPRPECVLEADAEAHFLCELEVTLERWRYEVAGGYKWQMIFQIAVPLIGDPQDPDLDAIRMADWVLNLGVHHVILFNEREA